jgi:hypothetical protein
VNEAVPWFVTPTLVLATPDVFVNDEGGVIDIGLVDVQATVLPAIPVPAAFFRVTETGDIRSVRTLDVGEQVSDVLPGGGVGVGVGVRVGVGVGAFAIVTYPGVVVDNTFSVAWSPEATDVANEAGPKETTVGVVVVEVAVKLTVPTFVIWLIALVGSLPTETEIRMELSLIKGPSLVSGKAVVLTMKGDEVGVSLVPSYFNSSFISERRLVPGLAMTSNDTGCPGFFCIGTVEVVDGTR